MRWGEYLCYGACAVNIDSVNSVKCEKDIEKLTKRLEVALRNMGLSRFSASVAIQFIVGKLDSNGESKFNRAISYLLGLLNKKDSSSLCNLRKESLHRCPQLIPGLRDYPFWETSTLPWVAHLEAAYHDIKMEFLSLKDQTVSSGFQHYRSPKESVTSTTDIDNQHLGESATDRGQWNVCYFYLHGMDFSENLQRCPRTKAAIEAVPRQYHHALYSALAPDTHVKPHCGPTNKKLRCHLPLHIPKITPASDADTAAGSVLGATGPPQSAWLRVGDQYRALHEGKCVVFDDSFEHEACNPSSSEPRVVLIVDVWHPDLSDEEVMRCCLTFAFIHLLSIYMMHLCR